MMALGNATKPPLNVILVEDDDADAKAVRRALSRSDDIGDIVRLNDGVEALAYLRGETPSRPPRTFVLLVDLNMPRMNGIEFLEILRRDPKLARSVVFVTTTSHDPDDIAAAYDKQVAGFLPKSAAFARAADLRAAFEHYGRLVTLPEIGGWSGSWPGR